MHLVGYLYEDYHDARSLQNKVKQLSFSATQKVPHIYGNRDVIYAIHETPVMSHMKPVRTPSSSVCNIIAECG